MLEATRLIWLAAGEPEPRNVFGAPIVTAGHTGPNCARCNALPARYDIGDLISANFVPTKNANRLSAYGGRGYCAACVFAARTLRLRCISWFASTNGIAFWPTRARDPIDRLLSPPDPPFVAAIPLYGIAHGGEAHWQRTWWPGETHHEPLIKLQSKHVAIYARVATSRDRYPVQVDDAGEFVLDRATWSSARDSANTAMAALVGDGVPPFRARSALRDLALPARVSPTTARSWPMLTHPLRRHAPTVWWPLFCELIPTLET